jgi:iron complex transport system substrate-binding protein
MRITAGIKWFILLIFLQYSCRNITNSFQVTGKLNSDVIGKAERLNISANDSCTIVTLSNPWQGADGVQIRYYLVKRGGKSITVDDTSRIIYTPIRKIICMSTTHLAMITALGEENSIAGVSGAGFIYDKYLLDKADKGLLADVGYENTLNSELILKINPDLVMMYGVGGESTGYSSKIEELGIKTMLNADFLEIDPLGKAEWIKLFGVLYCKEHEADSMYRSVAGSYNNIKDHIHHTKRKKPKVLAGLPYRDTWFVSPGNSNICTLIKDAGGEYLWEDIESPAAMPMGLESVYMHSLDAEYWINIGAVVSKNEIPAMDTRLSTIPAFKRGNLFNNNKRVSENGGNDYWESGVINPHLILKDLASILHPEIFKDHELVYYRKLE